MIAAWKVRAGLSAAIAVTSLSLVMVAPAGAAPVPGSQGTDTSLAPTDSQVEIRGRDQFAELAITVNQTRNLTNQAISIEWSGGIPTRSGSGVEFAHDFLQIMQCWGDDDGTIPDNPGPPPQQCVQGATLGVSGGIPNSPYPIGAATTRMISRRGWATYDETLGVTDSRNNQWMPFTAVDGTVVELQSDPEYVDRPGAGAFWTNPYFSIVTTNEIAAAATKADGTGAELMQVLTGVQSSGLGCGQKVQPLPDGTKKIPQCWIVVVPRGDGNSENVGTSPYGDEPDTYGVATSPLSPNAWKNRIAIPIEFNPVDSACSINAEERRVSGNELTFAAVASWQPSLCGDRGLPPFSYAPVSDAGARQQMTSGSAGAPGMIMVSRPLSANSSSPSNPVLYAPLAAVGLVIGFNIERQPYADAPDAAQAIAGVRVAEINLTPRLVAKLLTQSYLSQVAINSERPDYAWLDVNPSHLGLDPDFLQFNPEFAQLFSSNARSMSGLVLPQGNSDAARQVWEWILADPEAKAWMDGAPDAWGMRVNPVYSTSATVNPTGAAFGAPVPTAFPKSDPFCQQSGPTANGVTPAALCGIDWMPYSRGLSESAQMARAASDGARIELNVNALVGTESWKRQTPQVVGRRSMLALTDSASGARFGLQMARLSRAGDNGADRSFIAPDEAGLAAGVAAMHPDSDERFLEPDPTVDAPTAYPLTAITYAAIQPLGLDAAARKDYSGFVAYAASEGQVPGLELGRLPRGYAPLPVALQDQALTVAKQILSLQPPPPPTTTVATASTTTVATTTSTVAVFDEPAQPPRNPSSNNSGGGGGGGSRGTSTNATTTVAAVPPPPTTAPPDSAPPISEPAPTTSPPTTEPPPATSAPPTTAEVQTTAATDVGTPRFAMAGVGLAGLAAALSALEITKRPRRSNALTPSDAPEAEPDVD